MVSKESKEHELFLVFMKTPPLHRGGIDCSPIIIVLSILVTSNLNSKDWPIYRSVSVLVVQG